MNYDNDYCLKQAKWLIENYYLDQEELTKQLSGELHRVYFMGKNKLLNEVKDVLNRNENSCP